MIPPALAEMLETLEPGPGFRPVVAVAGPVAGGKTSLAAAIAEQHDTEALSTDDYLPDYEGLPRLERDEPRHADIPRLVEDVASLRSGRETLVPNWSFFENRRVSERTLVPGPLVVVEGLFALHPDLADLLSVGVFVDRSAEARRQKFVGRSAEGERGFTVEEAEAHFHEVAEPTLWKHLPSYAPQVTLWLTEDGDGGFTPCEPKA
ncbi:MAG: hypothetical protein AAGB51_00070 [Planctomycetota bacterium]